MIKAIKTVLKKRNYLLLFIGISIAFYGLFILIPVIVIAGNDIAFQLSILSAQDIILMAFLAGMIGLTFSLQVYSYKQRVCSTPKSVAQGAATGISGVFAAIVGTAFCASCLIPLFAAIGIGSGGVFFVLENNTYFVLGAIALMIISLYFAAKKVNKIKITS